MRPVVIWGTGGIAEELSLLINEDKSREIAAFCASHEYCTNDSFLNRPLIEDDNLDKYYPPSSYDVILTVGFKSMNEFRQKKFNELKKRGYYIQNYIHKSSVIQETSNIGEGNIIMQGVMIGVKCKIGNSNIIQMGCNIPHDITIGDFCYLAPGVSLGGFVKSEDRCFLGLNSTVFPYVQLAYATLVGAGAVVAKNTSAFDVYKHIKSIKSDKMSTNIF